MTRNPTNIYQDQTETYCKILDSTGKPLPNELVLSNFLAQKAWSRSGKIYFIGKNVFNFNTEIQVVDARTLELLPTEFPNLSPGLLLGDLQVLHPLADGKLLLAGDLFRSDFPNQQVNGQQALRLLPSGEYDPTYSVTQLTGDSPTLWDLDSAGVLRAATCIRTQGGPTVAKIITVLPNGSFTLATQSLNPNWPLAKPLMYHPYFQAFLFETIPIGSGFWGDLRYITGDNTKAVQFYVKPGHYIRPLYPGVANSNHDRLLTVLGNPAYPKFYSFGDFVQIQNQIYPKLARFHPNGQVDTTYTPAHLWSPSRFKWFSQYWDPDMFVTPKGRILFKVLGRGQLPDPDPYIESMDQRMVRIDSNGMFDESYKMPRTTQVVRLANGEFLGLKTYVAGVYQVKGPTWANGEQFRVLRLNAEGDSVGEYGNFTLSLSNDSSILGNIVHRTVHRVFADSEKGFWLDIGAGIPGSSAKSFSIRLDSNGMGMVLPYAPHHQLPPLKVEALAGKRFRMTGTLIAKRMSINTATPDSIFFNQVEIDSTGLAISGTKKSFLKKGEFQGRRSLIAQPVLELRDKKTIAYLVSPQNDFFVSWIVRLNPNNSLDKSFVPIRVRAFGSNEEEFREKLVWAQQSRLIVSSAITSSSSNWVGPVRKNGLYGFRLNSAPANTVFASGRVMQVPGPASGCNPANPRPTASMFLRSTPGNQLAISDTGGYYTFPLTTGSHAIRQSITNEFLMRQICPLPANPAREVNLANPGTVSFGNDFINQTFLCPRLELTIVQPRFRLCSRSRFTMNYSNSGMAAQPNARIRLNLPPEVRIEFASQAFVKDADSSYIFDLGTLQPGARGSILIRDTLLCPTTPDSLARACFSARIEPLALCGDIDPPTLNWDGAWLDATARYIPAQQQVRIAVYNRGANMADSTAFSLSRPGLPILEGKIKLAANDSVVFFRDPALQGSIQLLLNQPANCPLGSRSGLSHSGSGLARSFLNFGNGLWERHTVQACPAWRFSYDPNEKVVEPAGEVEPGTDFTYTIHFENYGNDTAYYVAVVDSLPSQLDVSTIRLGGSSHPYTLLTAGTTENPILTFVFNPIKLTGKKQDSVLSKGQLTFSIRMKDSTPRGETVSNRAHIYFDRNPAVITEYVHSKVRVLEGTTRVETSLRPSALELRVWPNPSSGTVRVGFNQMLPGRRTIQLTTVDGRVLSSWQTEGGLKELRDLKPGWYLLSSPGLKARKLVVTE